MPVLIVCLDMANTKPLVQLACVCEKAIQEADGVFTLIRIIDTAYVDTTLPPGAPAGAMPGLEYNLVIGLKAGDLKGTFQELTLIMRTATGTQKPMTDGPLTNVFTGGESGYFVNASLRLGVDQLGLLWFDVKWGDEVLTSVPLHLKSKDEAPKK